MKIILKIIKRFKLNITLFFITNRLYNLMLDLESGLITKKFCKKQKNILIRLEKIIKYNLDKLNE